MKILVFSAYYPPHYHGGYEINCEVTVQGLAERGHDCVVVTSSYGLPAPRRENGVLRVMHTIAKVANKGTARRLSHLENACLGRMNYRIARRAIEEVRPDLVYVWQMVDLTIFPVHAAHDLKVPIVYELGDYWLLDMKKDFVLESSRVKKGYRNLLFGGGRFQELDFSNVITISAALKRRYVEHGFDPGSITVIPRGIPESFISDQEPGRKAGKDAAVRLLYAGRLVEEKGVHIAVESVGHLVNSLGVDNVSLDIIGSGGDDYVATLRSMISDANLQGHVRIREKVPRSELFESYGGYDALLFPSIWEEPFGMSILEAMAKGLPVIATRVGGAPEIVEDAVNGLLVPPSDSRSLAEAVRKLALDRSMAAQLSSAGIRTVRQKFSQNHITDLIERFLLEAAARSNRSG